MCNLNLGNYLKINHECMCGQEITSMNNSGMTDSRNVIVSTKDPSIMYQEDKCFATENDKFKDLIELTLMSK